VNAVRHNIKKEDRKVEPSMLLGLIALIIWRNSLKRKQGLPALATLWLLGIGRQVKKCSPLHLTTVCVLVAVQPQLATQNHAAALSLLPSSRWDGEQNQKQKAKLMGWDKNSLTEWEREKRITTIILIKRICSMQCSHHLILSLFLSSKIPFLQPAPHLNTDLIS